MPRILFECLTLTKLEHELLRMLVYFAVHQPGDIYPSKLEGHPEIQVWYICQISEKKSPKPRKLSTLTTSSHILGHVLWANVKYVDVDEGDIDDVDIDDDDDSC